MSVEEIKGLVQQKSFGSYGDGTWAPLKLNRRGEMCVVDFWTQMAMEKRGYEIRGGTETEIVSDIVLSTTKAETCVEALAGLTIIPCFFSIMMSSCTSTEHEVRLAMHGVTTTAGTVYAANPLWKNSDIASTALCQMDDAGGVQTTADAVATANALFDVGAHPALGAYNSAWEWKPMAPALGVGPATLYMQAASKTVGAQYCFTLHWIELPTIVLG